MWRLEDYLLRKQKDQMSDTVTISASEYKQLLKAQAKLDALEGAGVDNWQGYDDAMDLYRDEMARNKAEGED